MEIQTSFPIIRKLFNQWNPIGNTPEDIAKVEKQLGPLPGLLKEYYLELGNDDRINRTQDYLFSLQQLSIENEFLVFYSENQGNCYWGIPVNQVNEYDPPVYCHEGCSSAPHIKWRLEREHLSSFFNAMAYLQAIWSLEFTMNEMLCNTPESLNYILKNFKMQENPLKYRNVEFYSKYDDSIVVIMENGEFLFYASSSEEHFKELHNTLYKLAETY